MKFSSLAANVCLFMSIPFANLALAQSQSTSSLWEHNGSVVRLNADADKREFYYQQPRQGMVQARAKEGALLFNGTAVNGHYQGTAYIFKAGCGQFPYPVSGPIQNDYRRVVLKGQAPKVGSDCQIRGQVADTLVFSLIEGAASPPSSQSGTTHLRSFAGVWTDRDGVCHSEDKEGGAAMTTIKDGGLTEWSSYGSSGEEDQAYDSCDVTRGRVLDHSSVSVDLECDHPGHSQKGASFIKLDDNRIQTPFGLMYRCQ